MDRSEPPIDLVTVESSSSLMSMGVVSSFGDDGADTSLCLWYEGRLMKQVEVDNDGIVVEIADDSATFLK